MNVSGLVLLLLFLGVEIALTNYFARPPRTYSFHDPRRFPMSTVLAVDFRARRLLRSFFTGSEERPTKEQIVRAEVMKRCRAAGVPIVNAQNAANSAWHSVRAGFASDAAVDRAVDRAIRSAFPPNNDPPPRAA